MNAPVWLPAVLAALMLVIAAYSLWRIALARVLDAPVDLAHDAVTLLLAIATAGMLVRWMHVLSPGIWALLLGLAGAGTALRAARPNRDRGGKRTGPSSPRAAVAAAAGCAVAVYMLLAGVAPSTISGSTAGYYTMAGMPDMYKDTTITFPALGIVFALILLGYAIAVLDRLSPPPRPTEAGTGDSSVAVALAPRTLALCEVAIVVTMAYAILAKLV